MSASVVLVVSLPAHCLCAYKASPAAASADTQGSVCCGVRRQMEGLELLLRGVPEEWTQVKRAAREAGEERERLKRRAEALVLAQELAEEQREAAVLSLSVHVYLHKCVYMYAVTRKSHAAMPPRAPHLLCHALCGYGRKGHTRPLSLGMLVWLLRPRIQGP